MAKWINTSTGVQVPESEVRELSPGTGIFVHERAVTFDKLVPVVTDRGRVLSVEAVTTTQKQVDGFAVKLADDATYNPQTDSLTAQAQKLQATARALEGKRS